MNFEWDAEKAQKNSEKHGVRFEIATLAFCDPDRVKVTDDRFDYGEKRLVTFGLIENRLFAVVHVDDEASQTIRIISARKANKRERERHANS